ncbi:hypothetical protein EII29_01040 [Leptotrichia sp. OH3620_COT-345]|uniref:hypothetical protein n=1 Tax=Leptotrichia sp. OH3620_COT-345 TaxID=2491048 RepID=UPI000F64F9E1|nr:hypothetical protein [Leptotrichia sp. OH3620_COT-345]RRD41064.1 hypothetical protein EII29_01040 [Leptotrichia sp. OH3620_COT-345]
MKNLKVLMMLLLIVAGISFAAGRSNKAARDKKGLTRTENSDAGFRKYCGRDESGFWLECVPQEPMPQ